MPKYAYIDDAGAVTEVVERVEGTVATHKLAADGGPRLRPVVETAPADYNPALEQRVHGYTVAQGQVTETWTVTRLPLAQQQAAVKAEARRRILAQYPEWKQANLTARAVELVDKKVLGLVLTAPEQAEYDALRATWDWIKSVRATSDVVEAMDPIPLDYAADVRWPNPL